MLTQELSTYTEGTKREFSFAGVHVTVPRSYRGAQIGVRFDRATRRFTLHNPDDDTTVVERELRANFGVRDLTVDESGNT
jgi:hypothetical protein